MLNDLKTLLGIDLADTSLDDRLNWILASVTSRLKRLLCGREPPEELQYIITEVSVIRFNRIGSEGLDSHSVEGESLSFADNDFAGYMDEIQAFLDSQNGTNRGRLRFI